MSLNETPLKVIQEVDAMVDVESLKNRLYSAYDGGSVTTYSQYPTQQVNNSNVNIVSIPPSLETCICPKVYANVTYRLTFTSAGAGSGNIINLGVSDAPRAFPLANTLAVVNCTINSNSISTLQNQWFPALIRYGKVQTQYSEEFSTTPAYLDYFPQYSDAFGTNKSPFANYGDTTTFPEPRGAFSGVTIISNTATSAVVDLEVYEPIFLPGFWSNKKPLLGVKQLSWIFTMGDLKMVWSRDAVNATQIVSNLSVDITSFQLCYKFVTPKILSNLPKMAVYNYNEFQPSQQIGVSFGAGATQQLTMQSLNLSAIPKNIYVYVRNNTLDYTRPDTFAAIDNISVVFMNNSGLLASATKQDIYRFSAENGLSDSWTGFNKHVGSVVCLKVGKELALSSLFAPGMVGIPQIQIKVLCRNLTNAAFVPILNIQIEYEGTISISSSGSMQKSISVLSSSDVLNSQLEGAQRIQAKRPDDFYGGSGLVDDAVTFGKDLYQVGKSGIQLGKELLPLVGLGGASSGGTVVGGRRKHHRKGGAVISRDELTEQMDSMDY